MKKFSQVIKESISGEDLKDLEICVNSALDRLCWDQEYSEYDTKSKWVNALKEAEKDPDNSELSKRLLELMKDEYNFDFSDSEVLGSVSEFIKKYAKEQLPEWQVVLKYSK